MFLVNTYINGKQTELLRMSTPIEVVVAARDLPEGTRLTEAWITKISEFNRKEPLKETVFIKK